MVAACQMCFKDKICQVFLVFQKFLDTSFPNVCFLGSPSTFLKGRFQGDYLLPYPISLLLSLYAAMVSISYPFKSSSSTV